MTWQEEFARCKGWLEGALEHCRDSHTIEDIEKGIESGEFQFWPGKACAAIGQICVYPRLRVYHIFLAGGSMAELKEMLKDAERWAKGLGCERVRIIGRRGWLRSFLTGIGYAHTRQVILEKEL